MWRDYYHIEYTIKRNVLFSRMRAEQGDLYYNLPISKEEGLLTSDLCSLIEGEETSIRFATIPEYVLDSMVANNSIISVLEQNDFSDYIYDVRELKSFAGRKYGGQRNHINYFLKNISNWSFEQIDDRNIRDVRDFFLNHYLLSANHGSVEEEENRKVLEVLDNFQLYGMKGGVLYADGLVAGFSINELIGKTMFTHIEKADRFIRGAYQMLVQQAASLFSTEKVSFINREEDMGDSGLRASKQSYHPIHIMKKYIVEVAK